MNSEIRFLKKYVLPVSVVVVMATLLFSGVAAHAAVVLESGIPGVGEGGRQGAKLPGLATYINYLYIFVLSFVGIAGFISLVAWGTVWIASAVVDKKALALEKIKSTLIGIGIALTAFIMLNTINPDLTRIKVPTIGPIEFTATKTPVVTLKANDEPCANPSDCISNFCLGGFDEAGTAVGTVCAPNPALKEKTTGAPGSMADGEVCYGQGQCYPGSACYGGSTYIQGICVRTVAGATLQNTCAELDGDTAGCVANPICKWCTVPSGGSQRCVQQSTSGCL